MLALRVAFYNRLPASLAYLSRRWRDVTNQDMQELTNRYHETAKNELYAIETSLSSRFAGEKLIYKKAVEWIPIYKRENEAYRKRSEHRLECESVVLGSLAFLPREPALDEAVDYHRNNILLISTVINKTLEYDKYVDRSLALYKEKLAEHLMDDMSRRREKAWCDAKIKREEDAAARADALRQIFNKELTLKETHASYYRLKTRIAAMRFWPVTDRNTARIAFRTNAFERIVRKREDAKSAIAKHEKFLSK